MARSDRAADPRIARFLDIYKNSDVVRKTIHAFYLNDQKLSPGLVEELTQRTAGPAP
mgnify:CR=1 FL=1